MGGNSGGGYDPIAFDKLEERILERLKGVARDAKKVVIAAEEIDQRSLASHMARSGLQPDQKFSVVSSADRQAALEFVTEAQVLVLFTDNAVDTGFLDSLVEIAFASHVQGMHAKAHAAGKVPTKILAYRLRSMLWDELVQLLR